MQSAAEVRVRRSAVRLRSVGQVRSRPSVPVLVRARAVVESELPTGRPLCQATGPRQVAVVLDLELAVASQRATDQRLSQALGPAVAMGSQAIVLDYSRAVVLKLALGIDRPHCLAIVQGSVRGKASVRAPDLEAADLSQAAGTTSITTSGSQVASETMSGLEMATVRHSCRDSGWEELLADSTTGARFRIAWPVVRRRWKAGATI